MMPEMGQNNFIDKTRSCQTETQLGTGGDGSNATQYTIWQMIRQLLAKRSSVSFFSPCWTQRRGLFKLLTVNEDGDDKKLDKLLEKFEAYCIPC